MSKEERTSKEERILHVVQIAKGLFIRQGYSSTSTVQIAREAGISEMTLFRYFPTKRDLFAAVISPLTQISWFPAESSPQGAVAKNIILELLHERFQFVKQERELVGMVIIESRHQPDLAGEFNPVKNVSSQLNELLMKSGLSEKTCQVIINLIMGLFLTVIFSPNHQTPAADTTLQLIERQIIELLREGEKE